MKQRIWIFCLLQNALLEIGGRGRRLSVSPLPKSLRCFAFTYFNLEPQQTVDHSAPSIPIAWCNFHNPHAAATATVAHNMPPASLVCREQSLSFSKLIPCLFVSQPFHGFAECRHLGRWHHFYVFKISKKRV